MPIYMKFEGIDGGVTAQGYEKWIELQSYSYQSTCRGGDARRPGGRPGGLGAVGQRGVDLEEPRRRLGPAVQGVAAGQGRQGHDCQRQDLHRRQEARGDREAGAGGHAGVALLLQRTAATRTARRWSRCRSTAWCSRGRRPSRTRRTRRASRCGRRTTPPPPPCRECGEHCLRERKPASPGSRGTPPGALFHHPQGVQEAPGAVVEPRRGDPNKAPGGVPREPGEAGLPPRAPASRP